MREYSDGLAGEAKPRAGQEGGEGEAKDGGGKGREKRGCLKEEEGTWAGLDLSAARVCVWLCCWQRTEGRRKAIDRSIRGQQQGVRAGTRTNQLITT